MLVIVRCELDLGEDPWKQLEEGRTQGLIRWNQEGPLPVSAKIRGAHSRRFPKKSLQVDMTAQRLPDEPPVGHTVRRLHLNADYIDPTMMRSALSYWLFDQVGAPAPLCRHAALTVSGRYEGLYVALESVDSDFCLRRGWSPGPIYYAVTRNANFSLTNPFTQSVKESLDLGYKAVQKVDTGPLRRMLMEINRASEERFPVVAEQWFDIVGYFRWLMVAVFVGNRDGFVHNYALYLSPDDHRFRIIPWDYDATWGIDIHGRPARLDRVPLVGWNRLTQRLLALPRYRRMYRKGFREALDSTLSPEAILPEIDRRAALLAPYMEIDPWRTGGAARFEEEVQKLRWWAEARRSVLLAELESF